MWQIHAMLAQDILHDRRREAEVAAFNRVFDGGSLPMTPSGRPSGPGRVRRAFAGALRRVGTAASTVSEGACTAAARLEGQAA
jgi:hypothetical protein